MDKEKAIKGLHQHCEGSMFDRCGECPYYDVADEPFICRDMLLHDVFELLKEQEAEIDEISDEYLDLGNEIAKMPKVVLCKDCKHRPKKPNLETHESGFDIEFPEGSKCPCRCSGDEWYSWYPEDDWFCAEGKRK